MEAKKFPSLPAPPNDEANSWALLPNAITRSPQATEAEAAGLAAEAAAVNGDEVEVEDEEKEVEEGGAVVAAYQLSR